MGVFNLRGTIVPLWISRSPKAAGRDCCRSTWSWPRSRATAQHEDLRVGIAADEVIGTFSATEDALLDQAPPDVPHCRGMLRHEDRLALVVDLRRLTEVFPVPVI